MTGIGPGLPNLGLQQVGRYLGDSGRSVDAVRKEARDLLLSSGLPMFRISPAGFPPPSSQQAIREA